ncbi:GIY-YIG nuclease family protein [Protaetiibacter mangrovi]|uniref:GIY-YIG nuclease family protein n=1 Tax=Protaetiibacter mangrovi TaxID=2970926 RepID=A0ABT1ZIL1_9MICO|nr:GIY-YIG nuclease family protein [Protaetiibacter mangrovi]MCS0500528.1 GIY-YIG nuclease family protein [Protaetiibacter mangrovi]TPX02820.1 GIY-YIG nuclease family protein [Schumannella luteola]
MTIGMYILRCGDGSYYVGSSRNVEARAAQHATGKGSSYTSSRMPVELVFVHECESVAEAYGIEKRVQGWSRAKREALIRGDFDLLPSLSRSAYRRGTVGDADYDTPAARATQSAEGRADPAG